MIHAMDACTAFWIFTGTIFVCVFVSAAHDTPQYNYDYMQIAEHDCSSAQTIDISTANATYGFISPIAGGGGYPNAMDCTMTLVAPLHHFLTLRFRRLDIYTSGKECTQDALVITGNTSKLTFCGDRKPSQSFFSTGRFLQLNFVSNSNLTNNKRVGFELYYTAFHTGPCDNSGGDASEFTCHWNRCIPRELVCDGYDNCGEWSDERASVCGLSAGIIVLISLGVVLLIIACTAVVVVAVTSKKKKRSAATSTVANAFAPYQDSYPVAYAAEYEPPPPYSVTITTATTSDSALPLY